MIAKTIHCIVWMLGNLVVCYPVVPVKPPGSWD